MIVFIISFSSFYLLYLFIILTSTRNAEKTRYVDMVNEPAGEALVCRINDPFVVAVLFYFRITKEKYAIEDRLIRETPTHETWKVEKHNFKS